MKTKILLTIGAVLLASVTSHLNAGNTLLSPRAADNQIKVVSSTPNDVNLVSANNRVLLSPRAASNRIITIAGVETVAAKCRVIGSPKYLATAGSAARMSCCNLTLAECSNMNAMPKVN